MALSAIGIIEQQAIAFLDNFASSLDALQQLYEQTGDKQALECRNRMLARYQNKPFAGSPASANNGMSEGWAVMRGDPESKPRATGGGRPKKAGTPISRAFVYNAQDKSMRLSMFYNALKAFGWIDYDTDLQVFLDLFSGCDTSRRVIWKGSAKVLAGLFKQLVNERKLISLPKGYSLWVMVNGHFWNKERNKEFGTDSLRNTHTPENDDQAIAYVVSILDPGCTMEELREKLLSQR